MKVFVMMLGLLGNAIVPGINDQIAKFVAEFPNKPPEQWKPAIEKLVVDGEFGATQVCRMLKGPGEGDDSAARYTLHALAAYAGAPGHERYRKEFVAAVQSAHSHDTPESVRALLMEQITLAGGPMGGNKSLYFDKTAPRTARAMVELKVDASLLDHAITEGSFMTPMPRALVDQVQAWGDLGRFDIRLFGVHDGDPIGGRASDPTLRLVLRRAAAQAGDLRDTANILEALGLRAGELNWPAPSPGYEQWQTVDHALAFARRLTQAHRPADAEKVYRLLTTRFGDRSQVRCAVLQGLSQVAPTNLLPDLVTAVSDGPADVRAVALEIGRTLPSRAVGRAWLKHVSKVPPDVGAQIVEMLGRRGDSDLLDGVLQLTRSENATLRHAAIAAVPGLGAENVVGPLVALLSNDADRSVAEAALARVPGQQATALMAEALADATPPAKVALLRALAARRATAQQDYIVAALEEPSLAVRLAALETLASTGNARALRPVIDRFTKATDPAERAAAKKAVSLLAVTEPDPAKRAAALERVKGAP